MSKIADDTKTGWECFDEDAKVIRQAQHQGYICEVIHFGTEIMADLFKW